VLLDLVMEPAVLVVGFLNAHAASSAGLVGVGDELLWVIS
jgi:hypothetical protein